MARMKLKHSTPLLRASQADIGSDERIKQAYGELYGFRDPENDEDRESVWGGQSQPGISGF